MGQNIPEQPDASGLSRPTNERVIPLKSGAFLVVPALSADDWARINSGGDASSSTATLNNGNGLK